MLNNDRLTQLTAELVAAYVSNNAVPFAEIPNLVRHVHASLSAAGEAVAAPTSSVEKATPAQIRKSITPNALVSFEDGKSYKMLRRHLTALGLTGDAYRAKWGLPEDYPLVAPAYSKARSNFAKAFGLGVTTRAKGQLRARS